jgi:segregation and condensation protein B
MILKSILEGALLAAGRPLTLEDMGRLFEEGSRPEAAELAGALAELQADCAGRGIELCEVASGWRFQVRRELAPWLARMSEEKPPKYSRALLETLAIIAYRQPITRADIEEIRGVAVNPNIVRALQEREWVRVVGHRDVPGRPELLATTRQFLDYFGLKSLESLPALSEIKDFEQINPVVPLAIDAEDAAGAATPAGEPAPGEQEDAAADPVHRAALARDLAGWSELSAAELAEAESGADAADPFADEDALATPADDAAAQADTPGPGAAPATDAEPEVTEERAAT